MSANVRITVPAAVAELARGLHPDLKKKIRAGFETIREDPRAGKELKDELAGLRSLRIGRHRIIYRLGKDMRIEIVAVGPREGIYEDTWRKLRGSDDAIAASKGIVKGKTSLTQALLKDRLDEAKRR